MLNWKNVEFVKSAHAPKRGLPEIAVVGRSNVGKSSLLNVLFNRKKLVKTSSTPGKTRTLQWFCVDDKFHIVDLPGFGYSANVLDRAATEKYLSTSENLKLVLHLIDSRHPPQKADLQFIRWAEALELPLLTVYTKVDKLPKSKRPQGLATSATKNIGRRELVQAIEAKL